MPIEVNGFQAAILTKPEFERYWPAIEEMMDRVPHTWEDLTKESIIERAHTGDLQVWGVGTDSDIRMVLYTQVAQFPSGPALQIIWGCGEKYFDLAGDAVDAAMEYFAKTQFCKRIEIIGRGGWERVLEKRGFKRVAVVLSRRVIHNGVQ